jgi:hypothetical protein
MLHLVSLRLRPLLQLLCLRLRLRLRLQLRLRHLDLLLLMLLVLQRELLDHLLLDLDLELLLDLLMYELVAQMLRLLLLVVLQVLLLLLLVPRSMRRCCCCWVDEFQSRPLGAAAGEGAPMGLHGRAHCHAPQSAVARGVCTGETSQ